MYLDIHESRICRDHIGMSRDFIRLSRDFSLRLFVYLVILAKFEYLVIPVRMQVLII